MSTPPIPPELCGYETGSSGQCVFTPHEFGSAHSWAVVATPRTGRIYSTNADGTGIRREPDHATREQLEKAGRKVFETKGGEG